MPFSALKGLREQLKEAETVKETRERIAGGRSGGTEQAAVRDETRRHGGGKIYDGNRYVTERGRVNKIDPVSGRLRINEKMIPIADIGNITLDK